MNNDSNLNTPGNGAQEEGLSNLDILAEEGLTELARSLKAVHFYPRGHPTLQSSLDKAYRSLSAAMGDNDQLSFGITKDGFLTSSNPLATNNQILQGFSREFFLRQIKKIFFLRDVSIQELENFLRVIAMEEDLFRGKGKAESYINDAGIVNIWANEIKLGQSRGAPRKEEAQTEGITVDERIRKIIDLLRSETDPRKFLGAAREASITAQRLAAEQKCDAAFLILKVIWEVMSNRQPRSPMIVEAARTAFKEMTVPDMIEFLLRQLTLLDGPRKDEVLNVAVSLGDVLIQSIINKITTNEALYSHRALIGVLLSLPDPSRPLIENYLDDDRWWVVRKMAFLLGEMKKIPSISSLIRVSSHDDLRVRKEILKAICKIHAPEGTKKLIEIVESTKNSLEIRIHVIRLLAASRELSAVPTLVKILKSRGAMLDNYELLDESIKALGKLGSTQAVPILTEILIKRSLFAKAKSVSLGAEAAEALGAIAGKEVEEIVQQGADSKHQEIRAASMKALTSIRQGLDQVDESDGKGE